MDEPACTVRRIRIHHGGDHRYELEFVGYEDLWVPMNYSGLSSKRAFQRQTLKCFDQFIDPPSRAELNRLLADAEHIPASAPLALKRVK